MKLPELTLFFPCYNEGKNIKKTVESALSIIPQVADKWEVIVINDGSKDNTSEVLRNISKKYKNIRVIEHQVNRGYGAAVKSGLYNAKYKWITYTDSDGQFDFSEIKNFIEKQKESSADLVVGYYKKRQVSKFKILTSKMWELAVFILFGLKVHDIDCGFKFISQKVVKTIPELTSERGAFISSEFLIKAKKCGFKIVEVPITHYPRLEGSPTGRNLNVIIGSFKDLFRLWLKLH